jgi:hypothetical protein
MNFLLIIPHYISWHYTKAISDLIVLFKNFIWFIWNLFSIKILLQTLFVPFQKLSVKSSKRFDIEGFFSDLIANILMRFVGFFIRTFFIFAGIFTLTIFIILSALFFFLWLVAPLILASMFVLGVLGLLKFPKI